MSPEMFRSLYPKQVLCLDGPRAGQLEDCNSTMLEVMVPPKMPAVFKADARPAEFSVRTVRYELVQASRIGPFFYLMDLDQPITVAWLQGLVFGLLQLPGRDFEVELARDRLKLMVDDGQRQAGVVER